MGTIRKRGDKWSYRVDLGAVNGKRVQKEKGGFATKKEAAAAMTLVENELLKTGEYVEAEQKITMQQYSASCHRREKRVRLNWWTCR